jgi:hypothetical protein
MELPFAVDATTSSDNDASSLVTASSQGSLVPADDILNLSQIGQHHHGDEDTDGAIVSSFSLQTSPHSLPSSSIPDASNNHLSRPPPLPPHQPIMQQPLFHPTIVDLPPSPPRHSTTALPSVHGSNFATIGMDRAATATSSSFGVDALKSAGSRVSSVLSHFGYNRSNTSSVPQANHSRPSGDPVVHRSTPNSSLPSSMPQEDLAPHNTSQLTTSRSVIQQNDHPDTVAIEFAYINVTDEDEVDIWLDDNHPYSFGAQNTSEGESSPPDGGRADILAVLLRSDVSLASQTNSTTTQLVSWTEQANTAAAAAVTAKRQGHLQEALDRHSDAAKLFHEAAHLVQEHDGKKVHCPET